MPTCGECRLYRPVNTSQLDIDVVVRSAQATLDAGENTPLLNREARLIIARNNNHTLKFGWSCISDRPVPSCRLCQVPGSFSPRP